ncbi:hypothetical protein LJC41_08250, partial [Desulfosarcina sp. OttesenSCG-928-G17]|nr:hypothetical protein [Desulfosarcina sp. OttesenSCG-928-G17]
KTYNYLKATDPVVNTAPTISDIPTALQRISFETETAASNQDGYLTGLIISDSDDGMQPSAKTADDRIKILELDWDTASSSYYSEGYGNNVTKIESLYWVLPNSAFYADDQSGGAVGITGSTTPADFFDDIVGLG